MVLTIKWPFKFLNPRRRMHFFCICCDCDHKWYALLLPGTLLGQLECPECGEQNSFAGQISETFMSGFDLVDDPPKPRLYAIKKPDPDPGPAPGI